MSFTPLYNHPANYPTSILGYTNKSIIGTSEFIKNYNPPTLPIPLYQQNWNKQITAKTEFSFRPYQTFIEFRHNHYLNNPIYQPFVEGQEYSVDTYISQKGKIMGVVPRRRDLVINGESQITTTVHNEEIIKATKQLLSDADLYGHQVVQFIKDKEGKLWLLECNSRYGGASAISSKCGLETFYWFVLESMGESIDDCYFPSKIEEVKQVRYPSDIYL